MTERPRPSPELLDRRLWRKHYFIPAEHGAWIWWIGPFLIGTAAGGHLSWHSLILLMAVAAVFFLRQPASIAVKALSGRRPRSDLMPGGFWAIAYSLLALLAVLVLVRSGYGRLLWLALPGAAVFAWHLWLVSRRGERGQMGVDLVAAGVLALAAPAAYWVAGGSALREPWILWALTWLQSAASIVFIFLRLAQRRLTVPPAARERWRMGARTIAYHAFNLAASGAAALLGWVPALVPVAFGLMLADALEGVGRPAVGSPPSSIGVRQLVASTIFVLLMVVAYVL